MTKAQCVSKPVFHRIGVIVGLRKLAFPIYRDTWIGLLEFGGEHVFGFAEP